MDLAWSDDDALLFAELDICYITAELGYNTVGAEPVAFDMDDLKALADSIDFALLDSLDTEAIAPVVAVSVPGRVACWYCRSANSARRGL